MNEICPTCGGKNTLVPTAENNNEMLCKKCLEKTKSQEVGHL